VGGGAGWAWLFWLGGAVIFYTYAGYGLLVYLWVRWRCPQKLQPPPSLPPADLPPLTLIVPAYNESAVLPAKLRNCLELDYPRERLEVVFITDGSTFPQMSGCACCTSRNGAASWRQSSG
jgi:cellulose synthase/poly-beta-1,6-N-acetylglucosamine synthase-like glycosyltransferase